MIRYISLKKNRSQKVNVIVSLEFELVYNDVVVQQVSHNAMGTHYPEKKINISASDYSVVSVLVEIQWIFRKKKNNLLEECENNNVK